MAFTGSLARFGGVGTAPRAIKPYPLLPPAGAWETVDDDVMGGRSHSRVTVADGSLCFTGTVSTENGGGFASIRAPLAAGLDGARALRLMVRGDGRRYQLRLRADRDSRSLAYRHVFDTDGSRQTLLIPLADLEPVFRGRSVTPVDGFVPGDMHLVGFMTAQRTPGDFRLEIESCDAIAEWHDVCSS